MLNLEQEIWSQSILRHWKRAKEIQYCIYWKRFNELNLETGKNQICEICDSVLW